MEDDDGDGAGDAVEGGDIGEDGDLGADPERDQAEDGIRQQPYIVRHPHAGASVDGETACVGHEEYAQRLRDDGSAIYGVFGSRMAWEVAKWAKLRGPSSTALTELLQIEGVVDALDLPFKNATELNKLIDNHLPGRPPFVRHEFELSGQIFDVYYRDIILCIKALLGDVEFCPVLAFCPEKHYTDSSKQQRLYHDMHTGKWWWDTQVEVEKKTKRTGATIIAVIFSSDQTQVTLFRNKSVYPLYMTLGNIPKEIRRKPSACAYVLLAYLPTSKLKHITNKSQRRRCLANVFHSCLRRITAPLRSAGLNGCLMSTADGKTRMCHPIFACYISDYPEQLLVTCSLTGNCPGLCDASRDRLGDFDRSAADGEQSGLRNLDAALKVLDTYDQAGWIGRCKEHRLRPVIEPFWKDLPFAHVYRAITPDVLHQLYQGVIKHLLAWLVDAYGAAEMDARCRRLPPNHNIRLFMSGISSLTHLTGQTHDEICRILLGLIVDAPLHIPTPARARRQAAPRIVKSVRGILDFLFLSQYPVHSSESLKLLNDALSRFHSNKAVFIELGIRNDFNIPKLHFASHYVTQIKLFGTTDNFNTQYTERLHIDYAKKAYAASNRKDELPQMTTWLERQEKVLRHQQYVRWRLAGSPALRQTVWSPPGLELDRAMSLAKHPTASATLDTLARSHGTQFIREALARYVARKNNPTLSGAALEYAAEHTYVPFSSVHVWHRVKYVTRDQWTGLKKTVDSIHARPARTDARRRQVPGRFDTALVNLDDGRALETGVQGYRVARVRAIFSIPPAAAQATFHDGASIPRHFAYVDWYTPFARRPDSTHLMYKVSPVFARGGGVEASILPLANIRRSVHLLPKFGRVAPQHWTSSRVLDQCTNFYVNTFTDKHLYRIVY
ncbi:hypothetical protein GGG16DRAFT_61384 [Schizophyllum commune]